MKVSDLFEAKRAETDKGYYTPGYDDKSKFVIGTVKDWLARMKVTKDDIAAAMEQARSLPSYKALAEIAPEVDSVGANKNGTFVFKKPGKLYASEKAARYQVHANGLIRSVSGGNHTMGMEDVPTRMTSPKPRIVAGDPVKSLVKIYDGAFKELSKKAKKRPVSESDDVKMYKIRWHEGYNKAKPQTQPLSWFSKDLGFNKHDRSEIAALEVGEVWTGGGPMDRLTVTRVKDGAKVVTEASL